MCGKEDKHEHKHHHHHHHHKHHHHHHDDASKSDASSAGSPDECMITKIDVKSKGDMPSPPSKPSAVYGPSLPPSLEKPKNIPANTIKHNAEPEDEDEGADMIGPQLPKRVMIGPALPGTEPISQREDANDYDSDDDDFGPMMSASKEQIDAGRARMERAAAEKAAEEARMMNGEVGPQLPESGREEWMTQIPRERNGFDPMRARGFRTKDAAEIDNSWESAPGSKTTSSITKFVPSDDKRHGKPAETPEVLPKKRRKTLLEEHQERLKSGKVTTSTLHNSRPWDPMGYGGSSGNYGPNAPSATAYWDHDRDMQSTPSASIEAKRKMLAQAQPLSSMFTTSGSTTSFL